MFVCDSVNLKSLRNFSGYEKNFVYDKIGQRLKMEKTAKTEKGDNSAQKLIASAKELFYEKGYKKTTVAEITRSAGVNNGLFTYYFGTKTNLSGMIMSQFRVDFRNVVSQKMFDIYKKYDLALGIAVEYRKNLEMLQKNPKLRRFTIEQYADVLFNNDTSYEEILKQKDSLKTSQRGHFYQMQKRLINPNISDIDLQIYQIAGVAATNALISAMHERLIDVSVEYMGDTFIELCFGMLKLSNDRIKELQSESLAVAKEIDLSLKNYFIVE